MDNSPANYRLYTRNFCDLEELRRQWGWFLILGITLIALGVIAIASSTIVTLVSIIFLGSLLLVSGILQIAYAFWVHKWAGFFLSLLAGILYGITGILLIAHPAAGALSLTLLLAAFYMVGGIFRMVGSMMMRFERWGWALFSGAIKFLLGFLIWQGWPETGLWVFGLFIGIDLIFFGWFWVLLSLTASAAKPIM